MCLISVCLFVRSPGDFQEENHPGAENLMLLNDMSEVDISEADQAQNY